MESAQATAGDTREMGAALDSYQRLTLEEVLADLPRLGVDELLLVESLEQAGEGRVEVLDRIEDLLGGMADQNPVPPPPAASAAPVTFDQDDEFDGYDDFGDVEDLDGSDGAWQEQPVPVPVPVPPVPVPVPPVGPVPVSVATPAPPKASLSVDLLDQMGTLLERDEVRRSGPPAEVVAAPPVPAEPLPAVISPRRRRRRLGRRALKVLAGLALVAIISVVGATYLGGLKGSTTSTGTAGPVSAAIAPGDPLSAHVLGAVTGYTVEPASAGGTGVMNLAKAVKDDGGPDAQTVLTQEGFVNGYRRVWTNTPQRQVLVTVYQFKDAVGAGAYAQRRIAADRGALKGAKTDFLVPGVPGVVGVSSTGTGGASAGTVFARGTSVARIVVTVPSTAGETALVQQLATQQYARL